MDISAQLSQAGLTPNTKGQAATGINGGQVGDSSDGQNVLESLTVFSALLSELAILDSNAPAGDGQVPVADAAAQPEGAVSGNATCLLGALGIENNGIRILDVGDKANESLPMNNLKSGAPVLNGPVLQDEVKTGNMPVLPTRPVATTVQTAVGFANLEISKPDDVPSAVRIADTRPENGSATPLKVVEESGTPNSDSGTTNKEPVMSKNISAAQMADEAKPSRQTADEAEPSRQTVDEAKPSPQSAASKSTTYRAPVTMVNATTSAEQAANASTAGNVSQTPGEAVSVTSSFAGQTTDSGFDFQGQSNQTASGQNTLATSGEGTVDRPQVPPTQIRAQVVEQLMQQDIGSKGNERITLQLDPAHLGKLQIQLQANGDRLTVIFTASSAQAEKALSEGRQELVETITGRADRWQNVEVKFERSEQQSRDQQSPSDKDGQRQRGRQKQEDRQHER